MRAASTEIPFGMTIPVDNIEVREIELAALKYELSLILEKAKKKTVFPPAHDADWWARRL
jgi:hypothetical protein